MSKLLTVGETAERLRKSEQSLRWMIHRRISPRSALIGGRRMFREEDVEAWIEAQFDKEAG